MDKFVMPFSEINRSHLNYVGGKGANLGELMKAGFPVPPGFCITTSAYRSFIETSSEIGKLLDSLDHLHPDQLDEISKLGKSIRDHLNCLCIPEMVETEIISTWRKLGADKEYAVRSSATAEDLPTASFAGQQDTYLNIKGSEQLLNAVRKCWASLFTDRSIVYRMQNGFRHSSVFLSVVVQRMVFPDVSGIMFTADPASGNRKIVSINASFGLGEALVSGIVSADLYQVKSSKLIYKHIAKKELAIYAKPEGGTIQVNVAQEKQTIPALPEELVIRLAGIGRSIENHFCSPQDIEWGLANNEFFILQSRPITTLYPVPKAANDKLRLFLSLGHPQMMTDAIKPLGISVLRTLLPVGKDTPEAESRFLYEAGSRIYIDATSLLEYPQVRKHLPTILLNVDEMIGRSVQEFISREDFQNIVGPSKKIKLTAVRKIFPTFVSVLKNILYRDNSRAIEEISKIISGLIDENKEKLQKESGAAKIGRIQEILTTIMPRIISVIAQYMSLAIGTYKIIENLSQEWLGDTSELGGLSKSPPGNITTEMGLALGDLSDSIRDYPAVLDYLEKALDESFWDGLKAVSGGKDVLPAFVKFMEKFGMRSSGEIDITRARWNEAPTQLIPAILNNVKYLQPGQHRQNFLAGQEESQLAANQLLTRLRRKPFGFFKVIIMRRLIKVYRSLIGLRESPKYFVIRQFDIIKRAIIEEAVIQVEKGIFKQQEDVYWLSLQEIKEAIETQTLDRDLIIMRQEKFEHDTKLTPPRVMTSEGEIIIAKSKSTLPQGALAGSPVSSGVVQGRARVVRKMEDAKMDKGDILVTRFTDPAWTPLFPLAAGLVTEVGGLMTHGAVVAREYGIPAVVGVENATVIIKDGQIINVDGNQGIITILD